MHRVWPRGLVILHVAARSQWLCAYACTPYAAQRRAEEQGESVGEKRLRSRGKKSATHN